MTAPVTITGGSAGIVARCEEIAAVGQRFGELSDDLLSSATALHAYLVHPGFALSGLFDPVGWAVFEGDLLDALDGPLGLTWAGVGAGLVSGELGAAAELYETAEQTVTSLHDAVLGALELPSAISHGAGVLARTGDPLAAAQAVVTSDPGVADDALDALGVPALLSATAALMPDGHGVAHRLADDPAGSIPPRRLEDVVLGLARRNDDPHHGAVDVRILTMADGSRRAIVDITGTRSWTPGPTADVTSLTTNGRALTGARTAYEGGVLAAMRAAGVRRGDEVMLVGHSQGGMVAVNTARHAARTGEFTITHVITAGSPIGLVAGSVPRSVSVLALENARDVVPHLDGRANPDAPNVTTATAAHGNGTVGDDHDVRHGYVPLAADVEASRSRSVRDFLGGARGYLRAASVTTHTFQITRSYR